MRSSDTAKESHVSSLLVNCCSCIVVLSSFESCKNSVNHHQSSYSITLHSGNDISLFHKEYIAFPTAQRQTYCSSDSDSQWHNRQICFPVNLQEYLFTCLNLQQILRGPKFPSHSRECTRQICIHIRRPDDQLIFCTWKKYLTENHLSTKRCCGTKRKKKGYMNVF